MKFLTKLKLKKKNLSATYWIQTIRVQYPSITKLILNRLVKKGLLKLETKKILRIFQRDRYYHIKSNVRDLIKSNIQRIVIEGEESDFRSLGILSLLYATNRTNETFSEEELETYLTVIRDLISSDEIGKSIVEALNKTAEVLMRSIITTYAY